MCDVQTKLLAWLDGELSADEAADTQRHVEACEECRGRLAAYEQVSETFTWYCDAVAAEKTRGPMLRWVPVLASAVAVATVMFLAFPRTHIGPPPVPTPTIAVASVPEPVPVSGPRTPQPVRHKTIRKRNAVTAVREQAAKWQPTETAVQIAIPAEAMFPPGAMPNGMNFIADLSIAPDGSVRQVRLRQ